MRELLLPVPSSAEMAGLDRAAQEEFSIPGLLLMEEAARCLRNRAHGLLGGIPGRRLVVYFGPGNNGADGLALARLWLQAGGEITLVPGFDLRKARGMVQLQWDALGSEASSALHSGSKLPRGDLSIDALLGTGAALPLRGEVEARVQELMSLKAPVLAVDIPTGVPGDGGSPPGIFVAATEVVCMGLPKPYLACPEASCSASRFSLARLGFPIQLLTQPRQLSWLTQGAMGQGIPIRTQGMHKGDAGKVLLIGGGPGTEGALALAARACLRAGAGLVRALTPPGADSSAWAGFPEVMRASSSDPEDFAVQLGEGLEWADGVVLGPGLGVPAPQLGLLQRALAEFPGPMVVDADGLRLLSDLPSFEGSSLPRVYTPHPGEASRLLGASVSPDLPGRRRALRNLVDRWGGTWLLKGSRSLLSQGRGEVVVGRGGPGLAVGGSGDVLSGLLGAFLVSGGASDPDSAEVWGRTLAAVGIHASLADQADRGFLASELADAIPRKIEEIRNCELFEEWKAPYQGLTAADGLVLVEA